MIVVSGLGSESKQPIPEGDIAHITRTSELRATHFYLIPVPAERDVDEGERLNDHIDRRSKLRARSWPNARLSALLSSPSSKHPFLSSLALDAT